MKFNTCISYLSANSTFRALCHPHIFFIAFYLILGLKLSTKTFSWFFSNLGPKLKISNQAKDNLCLAFPGIKESEIESIIFKMWENIGMVAAEFFHLKKISEEKNNRISVSGEEHLKKYAGICRNIQA